jgi:hypothetical protein
MLLSTPGGCCWAGCRSLTTSQSPCGCLVMDASQSTYDMPRHRTFMVVAGRSEDSFLDTGASGVSVVAVVAAASVMVGGQQGLYRQSRSGARPPWPTFESCGSERCPNAKRSERGISVWTRMYSGRTYCVLARRVGGCTRGLVVSSHEFTVSISTSNVFSVMAQLWDALNPLQLCSPKDRCYPASRI